MALCIAFIGKQVLGMEAKKFWALPTTTNKIDRRE